MHSNENNTVLLKLQQSDKNINTQCENYRSSMISGNPGFHAYVTDEKLYMFTKGTTMDIIDMLTTMLITQINNANLSEDHKIDKVLNIIDDISTTIN